MEPYPGLGLVVVIAFVILTIAIVTSSCTDYTSKLRNEIVGYSEGMQVNMPQILEKTSLTQPQETKGYTTVADLPGAPIASLSSVSPLPFEDPALQKAPLSLLMELKTDMDGFTYNELPHLKDRSDPAIKLPLTRLKGDYQRIKDEIAVLTVNQGIQSQLTLDDIQTAAANLRFLQRTYRIFMANDMVPQVSTSLTQVGMQKIEGFADSPETLITKDELSTLSLKLGLEISRLGKSATTDPVVQARINVLTKMKQNVDDMLTSIKNKTLDPKKIPIKKSEYDNFLPSLGKTTSDITDITESGKNEKKGRFSKLMDELELNDDDAKNGLSVMYKYTYTSPNELAKEEAKAGQLEASRAILASGFLDTNYPLEGGAGGARGAFEQQIREMDLAGFTGKQVNSGSPMNPNGSPMNPKGSPGSFDWKERASSICENIKRANLKPSDYGCLPGGTTSVSSDFSWRGHTKMVCNRLSTHSDPATPEQMGCPPVSWKGWSQ